MFDLIIVGAGPIGLYAAHRANLHNLNTLVLESLDRVGGQLTSLYPDKDIIDLPGFKSIKAKNYIKNLMEQLDSKVNIKLQEEVLSITKTSDEFIEIKTLNSTYITKTVLIATGIGSFSPRKLGIDNESNLKNIIYSVPDIEAYKNKHIVIFGGGDSAVDWAIALKKLNCDVTIVHRREEFRAQSSQVELMKALGVKIIAPGYLSAYSGTENKIREITIKDFNNNTYFLQPDYLLVNYGVISNQRDLGIQLSPNNLYEVNQNMQTQKANIFAVGNVCSYAGKISNITAGMGEVVKAITEIDRIINPNKNIIRYF